MGLRPIGSGGGSSGGRFKPIGSSKGKSKKKGRSIGGFIGNVAGDVRDATVGAVPAIVESGKAVGGDVAQAVEDTVRIVTGNDPPQRLTKPGKPGRRTGAVVAAIGKSYADTYGPLVKGDWRTFLDNVYKDPVFVALDAATLASLGVSGAVKVGVMPAKGGKVLKITTPDGTTVSKPLARGEFRAQLQALSTKVAPVRAATKETGKQLARADAARRAEVIRFNRELSRMRSKPERVATFLRAQFDRKALDEQIAVWRDAAEKRPNGVEARTLKIVTNPKVQALFDNPTEKMGAVATEARQVGKKQAEILGITEKGAKTRSFLPARVAGGARWTTFAKQAADNLERIYKEKVGIDKGIAARTIDEPGGTRQVQVPRTRSDVEQRITVIDDALAPLIKEWAANLKQLNPNAYRKGDTRAAPLYRNRNAARQKVDPGVGPDFAPNMVEWTKREFDPTRGAKSHVVRTPEDDAFELLSQLAGRDKQRDVANLETLVEVHGYLTESGLDMTKLRKALDERADLERMLLDDPALDPDVVFGGATPREADFGTRVEEVEVPGRYEPGVATPEENARLLELDADEIAALLEQSRRGGSFVGGPSVDELRARGLDPYYMPHSSSTGTVRPYAKQGGGRGIPQKTGNMRENRASLQLAGQLILDPSVLTDSYLRAAKYAHYQDVHEALLRMATPSETVPKGYAVVRKRRSERVSPRDKTLSEFDEWSKEFLDDEGQWKSGETGLTSHSTADALLTPDGKYLIVPERVAKRLAGEFVQQGKVLRWIEKYPTRVWRSLVLNVRPAYLINNVVGNTLLYLVHSSRPEDLRELAGAFKQFARPSEGKQIDRLLDRYFSGQVHGGFIATQGYGGKAGATGRARAVLNAIPALDRRWEQALRRAKVKAELRKHPELRDAAERMGSETSFFNGILKTFRDLERKADAGERRVEREFGEANMDLLGTPTRHNWKTWSRKRGYTEQEIADFEKWIDLNKRLGITEPDMFPGDEGSPFGISDDAILTAARNTRPSPLEQVLESRPDIVNQVYDRVNDALGNYDLLSPLERNKLRSLFPFYAWYKAIAGVTVNLALDQPIKANLLARLGEIAVEQNVSASGLTPEISGGFMPFGVDEDGRVSGVNTAPANPYATVGQLGDFIASPARGAGALALTQPGVGPIPAELYAFITGRTLEGYPASNLPLRRTIEGLPWFRLQQAGRGTGPQGDTLNDRDLMDEILRYLGVPYARRSRSADERVRDRRYG